MVKMNKQINRVFSEYAHAALLIALYLLAINYATFVISIEMVYGINSEFIIVSIMGLDYIDHSVKCFNRELTIWSHSS